MLYYVIWEYKELKSLRKMFGRNLKALRIERGFKSQEKLAEALGTDQSTVGRWESGSFLPNTEYRIKICKLLKVKEERLFADDSSWISKIDERLSRIEEGLPPKESHESEQLQKIQSLEDEILELKAQIEELGSSPLNNLPDDVLDAIANASEAGMRRIRLNLGLPVGPRKKKSQDDAG